MKILITGAKGQVGTDLVLEAKRRGHETYGFTSSEFDITDNDVVTNIITKIKPDVVINAAAYTAVDRAETEKEKAYAVNETGVKNLAEACKALDIPLLHISTDYVFDGEKKEPYLETDTPNPISVYGASKLAGEVALQQTWHKHIILRVSWVFGAHGNNFVKTMLRLAKDSDELGVVDDQYGTPTSSAEIANELLNYAVDNDESYGVFHLKSFPCVSWCGFAHEIFSQAVDLGMREKPPVIKAISSEDFPTPVRRPANSKLNSCIADKSKELKWKLSLNKMLLALRELEEKQ
jgi:dTDP-4-dehydrorhamnose reductase